MEKKLSDYLHLYLGCAVKHQSFVNPFQLKSISSNGILRVGGFDDDVSYNTVVENIKLCLRPLSDMTEDEWKDFRLPDTYQEVFKSGKVFKPSEFLQLLKHGFDLFGLIDSGLAIDKTKLKQ